MGSALFCDITQRHVVTVYRRFRTTYRAHLQGSRVLEEKKAYVTGYRLSFLLGLLTLEDGTDTLF
jgi:hypothetical protein